MLVEQPEQIDRLRRVLLELAVITPVVLAVEQVFPVGSNELDSKDLKETIEQEFTIKLYTLHDLPEDDRKRILIRQDHLQAAPKSWDQGRLILVRDTLLILPAHFSQENQSGQVKLILSVRNRSDAFESDPGRRVQLDYREFHPINPRKGSELLTHELSHDIIPLETFHTETLPNFFVQKIDSPWFEKVEEALDESYEQAGQKLYYEILEKRKKLPLNEEERVHFYYDMSLAFSHSDPAEVIGYLSGHFIHGWSWFSQMYGEIFPQSVVEKLYQFAKDEIFRGTEYL